MLDFCDHIVLGVSYPEAKLLSMYVVLLTGGANLQQALYVPAAACEMFTRCGLCVTQCKLFAASCR